MQQHLPITKFSLKCLRLTMMNVMLLGASLAYANAGPHTMTKETRKIIVSATGETRVQPDMAVLQLGVTSRAESTQEALQKNNEAMTQIIAKLKENSISDRDIQTSGLSIYQVNAFDSASDKAEKKPDEYQVSNNVVARIHDLGRIGKIFDESVALGANNSSGLSFSNAETKPYIIDARKKAVKEAIEQAKTLAESANVKLGPILELSEDSDAGSNTLVQRSPMRMSAAAYSDTPIAGGELNYNVSVAVTFEIQ